MTATSLPNSIHSNQTEPPLPKRFAVSARCLWDWHGPPLALSVASCVMSIGSKDLVP